MNSIITLKQYEKLTGETMEQEKSSFIETLIRVASDMIESYIGYDLEKQDRTEIIQKKINISRLWIKYPPINSVKNISINKKNIGRQHYIHTTKKIEFTDYFCSCNCRCSFTFNDRIILEYNSGYKFGDDGNVPYDLQYYVAMLVKSLFLLSQDDDAQKYSSYKINDIAYSYKENETFTKHIVPILKRLLW
ncbi:hypothetical protein [Pseudoleptotrichia goodfellowii]|uniref:Phage gp6-like head-tail connector protein n=1 Tax=Pseudoleptotrichia goodfellowii F0264 TaxID=596323 RepID=D0GNX8_9FUSO|nr:hypothetical protein [Pseudoleptotrichia goodfellowii]EEY34211.1 hypothetical protein HMPREF0554_0831 [Pseudoleptotrichia goodfellowii F0264]